MVANLLPEVLPRFFPDGRIPSQLSHFGPTPPVWRNACEAQGRWVADEVRLPIADGRAVEFGARCGLLIAHCRSIVERQKQKNWGKRRDAAKVIASKAAALRAAIEEYEAEWGFHEAGHTDFGPNEMGDFLKKIGLKFHRESFATACDEIGTDGFAEFVRGDLAKSFEEFFGRPTRISRHPESGNLSGPFLRFYLAVQSAVDADAGVSPEAVAQALRRAKTSRP